MTHAADDTLAAVANQGWDERIVVARCGTLVDVFMVVTARYVVLVDTLFSPATAAALLDMARPHLAHGRTLLVVNTHADWDHAWGNQVFAGPGALHPAPIIASRLCAARLRSGDEQQTLAHMQAEQPGRFDGVRLQPPTVLFEQRLAIEGDDLTLELFATPGHTADHISVYMPEIRTLLAGDAAESPFPLVHAAADLPQLRDSLLWMQALRPDVALYCHAPVTAGPGVLHANSVYFDELEQRCQIALARHGGRLPDEAEDVEAFVGFPFSDALPPDRDLQDQADFYHQAHRQALRAMLEYVAGR
jgi:glyoxylase-like metal-dependent hydrolase (beta-lactamase superfamily II)